MKAKIAILFVFVSFWINPARAGVEYLTGIKWSSCRSKRHCIALSASVMGTSSLFGEDYMFAQKIKLEIINLNDHKQNIYTSKTALWDSRRRVWTIFNATRDGATKPGKDYFFTEQNLRLKEYGHG